MIITNAYSPPKKIFLGRIIDVVGLMPTAYSNDWGNVVAQYGPYDEGTHSMSFGSSPSQQVKRNEKKRWEYKATKLPMPFYGEWVTMEHGPKKLNHIRQMIINF